MRLGWRAKPPVEPKGSTAPLPLVGEDGRPADEAPLPDDTGTDQPQQPSGQPQQAPGTTPTAQEGDMPSPEAGDEDALAQAARHAALSQDQPEAEAQATPAHRARHAAARHAAPLPDEAGADDVAPHGDPAVAGDPTAPATDDDPAPGVGDAAPTSFDAASPSTTAAEGPTEQSDAGAGLPDVPGFPQQSPLGAKATGGPAAPEEPAGGISAPPSPKASLEERLPQVPPAPRRREETPLGTAQPGATGEDERHGESSEVGAVLAAALPRAEEPARPDKDQEEAPRSRGWRSLPLVVRCIAYVAVIGLIGSAILLNGCFGLLDGRTVPDVTGTGEDEARAALASEGFEVEVQEQETQNAEDIGRVIATDPPAGAGTSSVGSPTVVVKVGKAREGTQEVPQLVGLSEQEALDAIAGTNFFVKDDVMRAYSSTVEAGVVISQGPTAGTAKTMGTKIDLVVSDGPAPGDSESPSDNTQTTVTVPDVTGMPLEDAVTLLKGMGLRVVEGNDVQTDDYAKGSVAGVDPDVDSTVAVGSSVTIHMAVPSDAHNGGGEG